MERCKLMQLTIFFLRFVSKGILCILDGIFKSLSLLESMCDLTNKATFVVCNIQYIWTDYTDIQTDYWEKIHLILFLLYTKYQYFYLLFYLNH